MSSEHSRHKRLRNHASEKIGDINWWGEVNVKTGLKPHNGLANVIPTGF